MIQEAAKFLWYFEFQAAEYRSMEWRLECQLGSRSLHNTVIPNVLTKWKVSDPQSKNVSRNLLEILFAEHKDGWRGKV